MAFFGGGATSGAAFELDREAGEDLTEVIGSWSVELRAGSRIVVARGVGPSRYEDARDQALDAANKGLDMLSAGRSRNHWMQNTADQHVAWWYEGTRSVVRVRTVPTVRITIPPITASGGTPVIPPPPRWHESLRYFRLSQTTDDLFEAYRNVHLALESILDTIAPQVTKAPGTAGEGEGDWFRRALTAAGGLVNLSAFAAPGASNPVDALYTELYRDRRSALFHAKASRMYLLPHGAQQRREVTESLRRATSLYLGLIEKVSDVRRLGGGLSAAGWRLMTDSLVPQLRIVATDDPTPFSADDQAVNPTGGRLVVMHTGAAPQYDRPFERSFLGQTAGSRLRVMSRIARICSTVVGEVHTASIPEGILRAPRINRFEVLLTLRVDNVNQPRTLYAS